ncbi:MAG: cysteine desulfurase [Pirellulaceae bacterium]|nr:cysteine desulfurase [Pirellulaceae bacterium]
MHPIYLDHATTTPVLASVRDSMLPFLGDLYGHPSSNHWSGRAAAEAIEDARSHLASLLDCHPNEIIFTSGGTESINLGLLGVARAIGPAIDAPHCIISNLEHAAVRQTCAQMEREGWQVSIVRCNRHGLVEPDQVEEVLCSQTRIVSITHASHQLGTVQPIADISKLCFDRDILLHTDASQTVGKIDCRTTQLNVDLLSLSGHKFHAPKGIGALYVRLGVPLENMLHGEGHEAGLRPGTPNVAAIAGLGQAAKLAQAGLVASIERLSALSKNFHEQLQTLIGRPVRWLCDSSERLPGIMALEFPGVTAHQLQHRLPEICLGPTFTDNGKRTTPQTDAWAALGLTESQIASVVRISIGWTTSQEELDRAAPMIASAYDSLLSDLSISDC